MKADGTWGDHVILHGAANCFDTCIHVISSHHRDVLINPQREDVDGNRLVLGHLCELHYVSLIPHLWTVKRQKRRLETDEDDAHLDWGKDTVMIFGIRKGSEYMYDQSNVTKNTLNCYWSLLMNSELPTSPSGSSRCQYGDDHRSRIPICCKTPCPLLDAQAPFKPFRFGRHGYSDEVLHF
ncbi:unnamed protein product [Porites evermanni]|uniref:Uncharacterized protein n=1 Tax=Porites evermanni TaxID=104178 RepID=A0ABN8S2B7_9CNID|nr:unnamed protein product [Porites evermanni]